MSNSLEKEFSKLIKNELESVNERLDNFEERLNNLENKIDKNSKMLKNLEGNNDIISDNQQNMVSLLKDMKIEVKIMRESIDEIDNTSSTIGLI